MNLDRICIIFCLFLCLILQLPLDIFPFIVGGVTLACVVNFLFKKFIWSVLFLFILLSVSQVYQIAKNVKNVTAYQEIRQIKIIKILHQQGYKTAIGELENGRKLFLKWQSKEPLKLGNNYQITLKIKPISGRLNKGNFNRPQWYVAHHIWATATVKNAILLNSNISLRAILLNQVKEQTNNLRFQGLILALAFGERAWLDNLHWKVFKQTTTAHLIAISGLHIGLMAGFGFWFIKLIQYISYFLLERTSGQIHRKICKKWFLSYRLPLMFSLLSAIFYAFLADFSLPTLRALFAICFVIGIRTLRRHYTLFQYWWRIIAVLLILDPITILSSSFWLSILSVMCIILWYQYFPLKKILEKMSICDKYLKYSIIRFIFGLVHLQLGLWLLFTPVQLYFFEGISITSFIANLIIVPFYSLIIIPSIFISLITNNLFNSWYLVDYLLQMSIVFLKLLSNYWITLNQYQQWLLLTLNLFLLITLYLWINNKLKQHWILSLLSTIGFHCLFYLYFFSLPKTQWITFDVGQGLANGFIYRKGLKTKAILYDTGVSWGKDGKQNSMAKIELLPYLKRNGIEVEAIFISHDDKDHSGGVKELLKDYPNAKLISSSKQNYNGKQPESCIKGKGWQFGDFYFESYYPQAVSLKAKNANSCVILITVNQHKILLTGDISTKEEYYFAREIGTVDFLQVAHHGSKTSTSQSLLNHIKPKVAIISTGRWNIWHLPNQKIIKRLKENKVRIFDTAKTGMISVDLDKKQQNIKTMRDKSAAWYNF